MECCDLCGSGESQTVIDRPGPRAMRSDRVAVSGELVKRACRRCGLVRSGSGITREELADYYEHEYTQGLGEEHWFFGPDGPVSRSRAFADWILSTTGPAPWGRPARVLEIGAGAGRLLDEMRRRAPQCRFEAVEPNRGAARIAREGALPVHAALGPDPAAYDIVYSIAVLEHVASPTEFLDAARARLVGGGLLVLSQPTQDVASYDVLFVDHLHHFGTGHLAAYARKCGFEETTRVVGHPLMPNFSLHVWRATDRPGGFEWSGPPQVTTCADTARRILTDLGRLDATLERLDAAGRRVGVFGVGEAFWVARCHSRLWDFGLVCGLDDRPDLPEHARLPFPVVAPEDAPSVGVEDVLLTMNRVYYARATARIERLGLTAHPVFSGTEERA